jgi:hypothetical protein
MSQVQTLQKSPTAGWSIAQCVFWTSGVRKYNNWLHK